MPEEEAFAVLVKLMQDYRMREMFKPSMAELGLCMYQLECLIQEHLPDLHAHFTSQSFHTSMWVSDIATGSQHLSSLVCFIDIHYVLLSCLMSLFPCRYASSWFLTLFSTTLQQPLSCRMMDCFLVDGVEVIFRIALACLTLGKGELFSMDMEGMLKVGMVLHITSLSLYVDFVDCIWYFVPFFNFVARFVREELVFI